MKLSGLRDCGAVIHAGVCHRFITPKSAKMASQIVAGK